MLNARQSNKDYMNSREVVDKYMTDAPLVEGP